MTNISVVICTYNNEKQLQTCLTSVKWADEIIVVDDGSTDGTVAIAKKFTQHIYHHKSVGYVEPVRNFAISKARGRWVLILDADEEIPQTLATKLQSLAQEDTHFTHVFLPRKNIIFGKWMQHTGWWPDHLIRFFKNGKVTWKNEIHSVPNVTGEGITLTGEDHAIVHHHYQTITQFVHKNFEYYAPQEAKELLAQGYTFSHLDAVRFPTKELLSRYFAREGYRDGFHGLILSLLMAMYHFILFLHLWEANKFKQLDEQKFAQTFSGELHAIRKEFFYWMQKRQIDKAGTPLKKIFLRLKRKIVPHR